MKGRFILTRAIPFAAAYLLGLLTSVIVVGGLNPFGLFLFAESPSFEEIERVSSPDNVVDAILVRVNVGAFSSYLYNVYVVPKGAERSGAPILNAKHIEGEKLAWRAPHLLEFQYAEAHIREFGNLWYSEDVNDGRYYVEVKLNPTSASFSYLDPDGSVR